MVRSSVLRFVERSTGGRMDGSLVSCTCWVSLSGPAGTRCGCWWPCGFDMYVSDNAGRTRYEGEKTVKVVGGGKEQVRVYGTRKVERLMNAERDP
ncbi:hypothetical protein LZ32DRAFT_89075 [Colletotrichum eremochloae]|nr:hypothetical protein LY78DRAFT_417338 [Colletotrichum sublineola]KAK2006571.1 hypothetical protein LZ32DRAFT_89075 [Colletotrichum eremochloae]